MPESVPQLSLPQRVATACRILAVEGLVERSLGHVSARVDDSRMMLRCRGPEDLGLRFATADEVRVVDFDGHGDEGSGYATPNELPIHGELYRARPEVNAVVHAHPPAVLLAGLAGLPLRPVFGAYNIPAMSLARRGVPVYPRSGLVRRGELARAMIDAMGDRDVCLLRGHGITVAGSSVADALVRALDLNALATVTVELARLGASPAEVTEDDLAELPDLGSAFTTETVWRHYVAMLALADRPTGP